MNVRPNFLPNQQFVSLAPVLQEHLGRIAASITPENFAGLCGPQIRRILEKAFAEARADAGSIWIVDAQRENLVVSLNMGADADKLIGFRQPVRSGIVSMVLANEHGFLENQVYKNAAHSRSVDDYLHTTTFAMVAAPFYLLGACRGVITCVQLLQVRLNSDEAVPAGTIPPGFGPGCLPLIQEVAATVTDLIDFGLLADAVGWRRF